MIKLYVAIIRGEKFVALLTNICCPCVSDHLCCYLIDHHYYTVQDSRHPGGCSRLIAQQH